MYENAAGRMCVAASLLSLWYFLWLPMMGRRGLGIYPENAAADRYSGDLGAQPAGRMSAPMLFLRESRQRAASQKVLTYAAHSCHEST